MEKYETEYYFDILSGGMVTGNRVGPLSQKSEYLKKKIAAIENTTGINFGDAYKKILEEGSVISNSEPPSIAFNVFKSFRPDLRFQLAHSIQDLHFQRGKDLNQLKTYFDICEEFEINKFGFMDRFQDPAFLQLTHSLFDQVKEWGAKHFPALMLERPNSREVIQVGYSSFEDLEKSFLKVVH
jgi:putative protein-disulfide isomerase